MKRMPDLLWPFRGTGGAVFFSLLAVALWGSSFAVFKMTFAVYDPVVVVFCRMVLASLCFVCLRPFTLQVPLEGWKDRFLVLFMGLCEPCLYFVFEVKALLYTTAAQASMILAVLPLLVAVAAAVIWREPLPWHRVAGFLTAVAGVWLLTLVAAPTQDAPNPVFGNLMECMAMLCAAGYTLILKKLSGKYPAFMLTGYQSMVGMAFFLPGLALPGVVLPTRVDRFGVCAIFYLGVVVSLGAYALFNTGLSRLPASRAAAFLNLIPVVGVFMGWVLLDERLMGWQWSGVAFIFAGVWFSQRVRQ